MTSIELYAEKSHALIVKYLDSEISERDFLIMHHNLYYEISPIHKQEIINAVTKENLRCTNIANDTIVILTKMKEKLFRPDDTIGGITYTQMFEL